MRWKAPPAVDAEPARVLLLGQADEIEVSARVTQGPEIAPDVDVGPQAAARVLLEAQRMVGIPGTRSSTLVRKAIRRSRPVALHRHLDRQERHVLDGDADALHGGHEHVAASGSLRRTVAKQACTSAGRRIGVPS